MRQEFFWQALLAIFVQSTKSNIALMKQIFRICIVISLTIQIPLFISQLAAQQMPKKYATLELFTNTPCAICGSQNPGLFNRLQNYEGQYHLVSFYPGSPYSSCIFYQANKDENGARLSFYPQVFGTPTVVINGEQTKSSSGLTTSVLDGLTGGESWLQVKVEESGETNRNVEITLEDFQGSSVNAGRLFAVVVEKEIMYNAPNGETVHHNVFRKFLSATDGDPIDLSSGIATVNYQYIVDMDWQLGETYVVAWLTNPETKEIYNSGTRFDELLSSTDDPLKDANQISLFPNPASSFINITFPEDFIGSHLKIFDVNGRIMHEANLNEGQENVLIEINSWETGAYLVEWTKDNRSVTKIFQVVK
jgi:hypothetical protein